MYNFLPAFFNDSYFNQGTIKVFKRDVAYSKGHISTAQVETETIRARKIIVPAKETELIDSGLGQYIGGTTFQLYVSAPLKFSSGNKLQIGDLIEYNGNKYKLISEMDFATHGFYSYYITKFKESKLND